MTVEELIKQLQQFPGDKEVWAEGCDGCEQSILEAIDPQTFSKSLYERANCVLLRTP